MISETLVNRRTDGFGSNSSAGLYLAEFFAILTGAPVDAECSEGELEVGVRDVLQLDFAVDELQRTVVHALTLVAELTARLHH